MLRAYRRVLGRAYDVVTAERASEALALVEAPDSPIDVVICDYNMADMLGREFFRALAARAPSLAERFVFATGRVPAREREELPASLAWVEKPIDFEALCALVARLGNAR